MIFLPTTIYVDRAIRPGIGSTSRGLEQLARAVEAALAIVIIPLLLLAVGLVGVYVVTDRCGRRIHDAIHRNARRLGRGMR